MKTCEKCGVELNGGDEIEPCSPIGPYMKNEEHTAERCRDRLSARLAEVECRESDLVEIGAHMATILYNCSQESYEIEPRDRRVMREWCDRWDAASRERSKALAAILATGGKETK